jgi:hypothetical protein
VNSDDRGVEGEVAEEPPQESMWAKLPNELVDQINKYLPLRDSPAASTKRIWDSCWIPMKCVPNVYGKAEGSTGRPAG